MGSIIRRKLIRTFKLLRVGSRKASKTLKIRRPIARMRLQNSENPLALLYNKASYRRVNTYNFLRKNFSPSKVGRNILRKKTSAKRVRRNPLKFSKKSSILTSHNPSRLQAQHTSTIRLRNASYSFTLKNSPLYISYKFNIDREKFLPFKAVVKKLIFSFLKPNQIKRSLMLRRQKITYFRFFNRFNKRDMSTKFLLTNYSRVHRADKFTVSSSDLSYNSRLKYHSYVKPFFSSLTSSPFMQRFPSYEAFKGEVHVPRVRFKPGYQRLWRQSRRTLAESMRVRYIYQQQFTKYITRFGRKLNNYHFSRDEYTMSTIVLYSRLIPDYNTLLVLNKAGCLSVNGYSNTGLTHILFTGDVVQLSVSNWMYTYLKWVLLWTSNRVKKFRKLVYRKNLAGSYKAMKRRKQRSNYTPLWIYHTKYDISDIKPFLETDFFTMSSVLIYDNFIFDFYTPSWFIEDRQLIYRLYNWKYIT